MSTPVEGWESASKLVLEWIRASEATDRSVEQVRGIRTEEHNGLARLGSLALRAGSETGIDATLIQALQKVSGHIDVPAHILRSFRSLLSRDVSFRLAQLYVGTVSAGGRRALGTFFTPSGEAKSMVLETATAFEPPEMVVDVGAGVGVFSLAAHAAWPQADICAIDVNPVTLALQKLTQTPIMDKHITLHLTDFSRWLKENKDDRSTLYLGNPPYTRWQEIPEQDRRVLLKRAGGLVKPRANLSTLFLSAILLQMKRHDSLCLIVPASWMSTKYAGGLRAHLRGLDRREVVLRIADSWRFDDAMVDAVAITVGPEKTEKGELVVSDWSGEIRQTLPRTPCTSEIPRNFERKIEIRSASRSSRPLSVYAKVTRGIATGANSFFIIGADDQRSQWIDPKWSQPVARRLRKSKTDSVPHVESARLLALDGTRQIDDPAISAMILEAEALGTHKGYLCRRRKLWFDLTSEIKVPDVLISALSRNQFQFYENKERYCITNNLFGLSWKTETTEDEKKKILAWLQNDGGQEALKRGAAREANGLLRLSPAAIESIGVPETKDR